MKAGLLRDGPKLKLVDGHLPVDVKGFEVTGFNESWWLGLGALHTLFAREHNLLCDELRSRYRTWDDEHIYQTARLIVSALIAKIHTVEWTPAILATRAIDVGLSSNWNGPPANDWLTKLGIWLIDAHALTGIPKTLPDHHGAPYSLTEDFVTVYRMHPLLPDDYCFYDHTTGTKIAERGFLDIQGAAADDCMRALGLRNTLYSFGIAHPGAITLHNFPVRSLHSNATTRSSTFPLLIWCERGAAAYRVTMTSALDCIGPGSKAGKNLQRAPRTCACSRRFMAASIASIRSSDCSLSQPPPGSALATLRSASLS